MANISDETSNHAVHWKQDEPDEHPVAWSKEKAEAWRESQKTVSPWRLVIIQIAVVSVMTILVAVVLQNTSLAMSVAYGGLCVVVPSAMFMHGVRVRQTENIQKRMLRFVVWELAKIVLTVVMLYSAPRVISELNWLALLAGFVVTIKLYWVTFLKFPKLSR
jgi:ATP synthase protein I